MLLVIWPSQYRELYRSTGTAFLWRGVWKVGLRSDSRLADSYTETAYLSEHFKCSSSFVFSAVHWVLHYVSLTSFPPTASYRASPSLNSLAVSLPFACCFSICAIDVISQILSSFLHHHHIPRSFSSAIRVLACRPSVGASQIYQLLFSLTAWQHLHKHVIK